MKAEKLTGLEGDNPCGLLACLGTLWALERIGIEAKVWWDKSKQTIIEHSTPDLAKAVYDSLQEAGIGWAALKGPLADFKDVSSISIEKFPEISNGQHMSSIMAGLGADCAPVKSKKNKKDEEEEDKEEKIPKLVAPSSLVMRNDGAHQHFFNYVRTLTQEVDLEGIRKALFSPWTYRDKGCALGWDVTEGLRNIRDNPSCWAGNRLALEGLPSFPVIPGCLRRTKSGDAKSGARTLCFEWMEKEDWFSWPLWTKPMPLAVVNSMLGDRRSWIKETGISWVYKARRISKPQAGNPPFFCLDRPIQLE